MKRLFTLVAFLTLAFSFQAQKYCGFDLLREAHIEAQKVNQEAMDDRILDRILTLRQSKGGGDYVVPIVIHVIHQNGDENIDEAQIEEGISALNQAFSNSGDYSDQLGVDVGIQFCLAQTDPNGEITSGINYVEDALTNVLVPSQEQDLKDIIRWNTELYLNIWLVAEITREEDNSGVIGFATFPDAHGTDFDGIVIEAQFFGNNLDDSKVIMHEVGHYLGLFHTFQDACPNGNCLLDGDRVCDTPPDAHVFNTICFDGTNSCLSDDDDLSENNPFRPISEGGLGDQEDMQTNYMDYSSLYCFIRFTQGQKERMLAALLEYRASLLEGDRCNPPCEDPINVNAFSDALDVLVNESVTIANASSGYTSAEWWV
ncbi:MAG: hypothetical protein HKN32_06530, partial [Flavobacteriales bacterium]|nr:hypothetical protein [Flavobacteriales bacterium]